MFYSDGRDARNVAESTFKKRGGRRSSSMDHYDNHILVTLVTDMQAEETVVIMRFLGN